MLSKLAVRSKFVIENERVAMHFTERVPLIARAIELIDGAQDVLKTCGGLDSQANQLSELSNELKNEVRQ